MSQFDIVNNSERQTTPSFGYHGQLPDIDIDGLSGSIHTPYLYQEAV